MPETGCNWDKLAWLNSSDPAYAEQFKICVGDPAPGVDIIQLPGFAEQIGIYVTFPSADFGEMSLKAGQYATQGVGMILYLSAFKMKETEVSIVCENKEYIFTVYNAKGSDEPIDERVKREIVFVPGDVKMADPSMFVMAFGNGKEAYSTVMNVKKVEEDTIYVAQIPEELDSLIFVRAAHGLTAWKDLQWGDGGNVWNQTPNQKIACDTATFSAWDNYYFNVTWCPEAEEPIVSNWYIAGDFTTWATGMVELKGEDAKALSANINILQSDPENPYQNFKVVRVNVQGEKKDTMWFGIQEWAAITSNNLSMTVYPSVDEYNQANVGLQMTKDGDYTFTVDVTAMTADNVLAPVVTVAMPQPDPVVSQYGLLINGETFVEAVVNPANEQELMATGVSLVAGQTFVLHDKANNASWTISNFNEGSYIFSIENNAYVVTETALYDFYVYPNYDNSYIYVSKQEQTDVDNVVDGEQLRKVIENGTLYIYRDGKKYSVQGYRVY